MNLHYPLKKKITFFISLFLIFIKLKKKKKKKKKKKIKKKKTHRPSFDPPTREQRVSGEAASSNSCSKARETTTRLLLKSVSLEPRVGLRKEREEGLRKGRGGGRRRRERGDENEKKKKRWGGGKRGWEGRREGGGKIR
jgi:hypothetical protein